MTRRGWILFASMSLLWGLPYLLITVAVRELDPVLVVFGRCLLGAVLLLPLTRGRFRPALRHWRPLLLFAVLEMTGPWLLLSYAEQSLSSSLTGLLVATVPFVSALAARLAGSAERLSPGRIAGMLLGVIGIVLLLGLDVGGAQLAAIGAVALVIVGYATAPLVVTRSLGDVPGVVASAIALTLTTVVYAPFALPRIGQVRDASLDAIGAMAVLGVLCTALGLVLFFALIREVGPQRALIFTFVNPAVAVLLGVLLLSEPFTLGLELGLPLILLGSVLATRRDREPPVPAAA